jgi:hypothetical protein
MIHQVRFAKIVDLQVMPLRQQWTNVQYALLDCIKVKLLLRRMDVKVARKESNLCLQTNSVIYAALDNIKMKLHLMLNVKNVVLANDLILQRCRVLNALQVPIKIPILKLVQYANNVQRGSIALAMVIVIAQSASKGNIKETKEKASAWNVIAARRQ